MVLVLPLIVKLLFWVLMQLSGLSPYSLGQNTACVAIQFCQSCKRCRQSIFADTYEILHGVSPVYDSQDKFPLRCLHTCQCMLSPVDLRWRCAADAYINQVNGLAHAIASFEEEKKDFTRCAAKVPACTDCTLTMRN